MGSPFPLCDLLCHENKAFLDEDEEAYTKFNPHPVFESEDEYVRVLIQKESIFEYNSPSSAPNFRPVEIPSWLKHARLEEIEWVINTRPLLGYQYGTAFLSLTYLDRFISTRKVNSGSLRSVRLLSVACLALAAKMLETKPPSLSEYDIDDHHDFKSKEIYETELLVLNALHWKMGSITPFAYLNQFTNNFCLQYQDYNSANLAFTATVLIFAIPQEIHLMDFRPSIIAVAAVLAACEDQLTRQAMELNISVIPSWGSLNKEDIYSCYNLMQEMKMGKSNTPNSAVLSNNSSSIGNSSNTPGVSSNRSDSKRRLTFNSPDQHCPPHKNHHP
ncbi:cyclin-D5-1-like [Actinidia eriantha]|uniref:cyclin-D5-1-like n=1 Tax=Actinidia eriantha TaxID=165200 RepID=UPI00258A4127|nr:cyclin-D5-1-like [Actinidia eriantha]